MALAILTWMATAACRQTGARLAPFVFTGVSIAHPRLFADAPKGKYSLNALWNRAIEQDRLSGIRLDGVWMHVGTPEAVGEAEAALRRAGVTGRHEDQTS